LHKQQPIANKQQLTDSKPQQIAKYGKLRFKEFGNICLDKAGTGGTAAMVDKPIPKKPIQKSEPVIQSTKVTDKPVARMAGDQWLIEVYPHHIIKSRFSCQLTINNCLRFNLWHIDDRYPRLFGCFATPHEAIAAGLEEVED
jgi:hypothetical protein